MRTVALTATATLDYTHVNATIEVTPSAAAVITLPVPNHILADGDVITVRKAGGGTYSVTVGSEVLLKTGDSVSYYWQQATWTWVKFSETREGALFPSAGSAAGEAALLLGATSAEGLSIKVIEETISMAGNTALYKAMTTPIPANSVILSVSANVESALTGGSTTVKVGLGPNASDPDKYGKTSALTKNAKISTIPTHAVLSSQEAIDVCACATNGAAGDTALTVGSVRVRIVYFVLADLANAA